MTDAPASLGQGAVRSTAAPVGKEHRRSCCHRWGSEDPRRTSLSAVPGSGSVSRRTPRQHRLSDSGRRARHVHGRVPGASSERRAPPRPRAHRLPLGRLAPHPRQLVGVGLRSSVRGGPHGLRHPRTVAGAVPRGPGAVSAASWQDAPGGWMERSASVRVSPDMPLQLPATGRGSATSQS